MNKTVLLLSFLLFSKISFSKDGTGGQSFDLLNCSINLSIRNLPAKTISGYTELTLLAGSNSLSKAEFDLLKLHCDSVFVTGSKSTFLQNDSILSVNLPSGIHLNDTFKVRIFYHGQTVTDKEFGGFYFNGNYAYNLGVAFHYLPHNFGRAWFPCIDNFIERSTYDFHITTDSGYMAVCNGLSSSSTNNADGSMTWHWRLSQQIPSYLACVAVAPYSLIRSVYHGKSRDFEIIIASYAGDTNNVKLSFANLNRAMQLFENDYLPYAFDRAGYVIVPFSAGGAMEHASCITYPSVLIDGKLTYETTMAHELSHHWWGDLVTCRTASDMWLNEGWAVFNEALFEEAIYGKDKYTLNIAANLIEALRWAHVKDGDFRAVTNIPDNYTYGTHVYQKGSLMVHALRTYMGDSSFFIACKAYLTKFAFKDVSTYDLRDEFQKHTSVDLIRFFNEWIFEKGYVDVVIRKFQPAVGSASLQLSEATRATDKSYSGLPLRISFYDNHNTKQLKDILFNGHDTNVTFTFSGGFTPAFAIINENHELPLARTYSLQNIKGTGLKQFTDALFSITVTTNSDSALILAEHHWTRPDWDALKIPGLKICDSRYWRIDGNIPVNFKATAFLNYDGSQPSTYTSGWLDSSWITNNEDSIVLLYRQDEQTNWQIHTDNTKQAGTSNTDKIGRFWINSLQKGEYTFAIYDALRAGISESAQFMEELKIYPNPNKNKLHAALNFRHDKGLFNIYDMNGKLISQTAVSAVEKEFEVDTSSLMAGTYFIIFEDAVHRMKSKFVIE